MMDRYAVIGHPVAQSRSPFIHAAFARQLGHDLTYEAILAPLDGFVATVNAFITAGGKGLNVTAPFKLEAYHFADRLTARARAAQAVNTLKFEADGILGDNTDGVGLVMDIQERLGIDLTGRRVLVIGAGGAARGILLPLAQARPERLWVVNRTADKAHALIADLITDALAANTDVFGSSGTKPGGEPPARLRGLAPGRAPACGPLAADPARGGPDLRGGALTLADGQVFDVVIHATSAGLNQQQAPAVDYRLAPQALAYDLAYARTPTPFLDQARVRGAVRLADGHGMLVGQAAESYAVWTGVRPETSDVLAALLSS